MDREEYERRKKNPIDLTPIYEPMTTAKERLEALIRPIHARLVDAAIGPLRVAKKILDIGEVWEDEYQTAAGGASFSAYLREQFGNGRPRAFWERRADAEANLGPSDALHHEVGVWIISSVPVEKRKMAMEVVRREWLKNGRNPIGAEPAERMIRRDLGLPKKPCRECKECERLRVILDAAGLKY